MNMTTTTQIISNTKTTTTISQEQLLLYYQDPIVVVRIYQIGYFFTFLLGFPGNIASLLTFSQPTLRKVSTGCLFITLAISDTIYLLTYIFDFLEFGLKIPFYRYVAYDEFCRFRSFVINVTQVLSSWILVIVSIDRWIRTRFPFKSNSICTPKKALIAVGVLLVIDIALHAHILTPMFGTLVPVPAGIMLAILIDIFIIIRARKRAVIQPMQYARNNKNMQQYILQKQIFILMLARVGIFLITLLPLAIYKILSPRQATLTRTIFQIISVWASLQWFQSLFYAVNIIINFKMISICYTFYF
ncbi:unnamed protein product [Rotaria sordida]|uniref:G-protein coupled receptors family 1 profile domain-containing protein n=1 Tax=Rotaria sordida TaxID=392033 RepID=A0A819GEP5_9BILA|nr:unnamed protein product [Rotaria sordida]CAF3884631.1 unnamed protein product [Rotaria sordida]